LIPSTSVPAGDGGASHGRADKKHNVFGALSCNQGI